ncbi:MAG TPA: S46 family peptidase, partial [Candidatus Xenobia bacterium]
LALALEPRTRELRQRFDQRVVEPQRRAYAKIAQAAFQAGGEDTYPDATFTLRLSVGEVRGLSDAPAFTRLGDLYRHGEEHDMKPPYCPPVRWLERRDRLDPNVPFNFISTADIVGGNSGSPVVNRRGELVGLIFDGNIDSLVLTFMYTDTRARAVSVDARAILTALRDVYDARALVDELSPAMLHSL